MGQGNNALAVRCLPVFEVAPLAHGGIIAEIGVRATARGQEDRCAQVLTVVRVIGQWPAAMLAQTCLIGGGDARHARAEAECLTADTKERGDIARS